MSLLNAHQLGFRYSAAPLFWAASFAIGERERIALVGANGAGKSTLLQILAGEMAPDEGRMVRRRGLRVRRLPQESVPAGLSSGERMRAALEDCLGAEADLLLLDEPTNHLDIPAREWLEQALGRTPAAVVVVSHDRVFLNRVTARTLALERGTLEDYAGNYDFYRAQRALRERQGWARYEAQQRRFAASERAAARRTELAAAVATAPEGTRGSKDFYARKAAKVARTARLLRERAGQEERVEKPWQESAIPRLDFGNVPRSGDIVLRAEGLAKSFGAEPALFRGLSFTLRRGERWAVLGRNGSGKSTLLRILAGLAEPDEGRVHFGAQVRTGYYAQEAENLERSLTPVEICRQAGGNETAARTLLGCLKLPAERVTRPLATLSAGECSKVALARLLLSPVNLLLLDEPTNHLEIEAIEALAPTLEQFPGTLVLVTHDRYLIERLAGQALRLGAG